MKLTIIPEGHSHNGVVGLETNPVNRWRVNGIGKDVFIIGFNLNKTSPAYFQITGRAGNYRSTEEALAALQQESDEQPKYKCLFGTCPKTKEQIPLSERAPADQKDRPTFIFQKATMNFPKTVTCPACGETHTFSESDAVEKLTHS